MRRRILTAATVTVAGIIACSGIALASVPDSNGVIHACYKPQSDGHSSVLGVIDTALSNGHCPSGQTELTWNQTGPQGPVGPTGATGATGPQGPAGTGAITGWQKVACTITSTDSSGHITAVSGSYCSFTDTTLTVSCPTGKVVLNAFQGIAAEGDELGDTGSDWAWTYDSASSVTLNTFLNGSIAAPGWAIGLLCADGSA